MEDEYLKEIWNSPDKEIKDFFDLNDQSFQTSQINKAKTKLKALLLPKTIGIVLGLGWISLMFLLIYFCIRYSPMSVGKFFFVGSISMIFLSTGLAVFLYVKDIFIIKQIDNSESLTITQRKLATLQFSIMKSVRILWLQLPFYTTWYLNDELIMHGSPIFWIIQILCTGLTTWLAIWLFKNMNYKNSDKKWIRNFMRGYGFYSVIQALDFIKEIDSFNVEIEQ